MIITIPHRDLSPEALQGLIEEFVTRDGTDYGEREVSLATKVARVRRQLEAGTSVILFDSTDSSMTVVAKDIVPEDLKSNTLHDP